MNDEAHFQRRAAAEAHLAEGAALPEVRSIHEEMRDAYLERVDMLRRSIPTLG